MRNTAVRLAAIVAEAEGHLRVIPEREAAAALRSGGWSAKQALGHLIDSASNNHQRFVRAALQDGLEWPSYDQNGCVRIEAFQEAPWDMLIDVWSAMNRLLSHVLAHLPSEKAQVRCRIGGEADMPLEELARAYVAHLQHHLAQLAEPRLSSR